jgi:hypothetical protein
MKRRKAIKLSAAGILGAALATGGSVAFLGGCKAETKPDWMPSGMDLNQLDLVTEMAEMIIPKTDTPGAKDALVHRYIDNAVHKFFTPEQKTLFTEALTMVEKLSTDLTGKSFVKTDNEGRTKVMDALVTDSEEYNKQGNEEPHIFDAMVEMVRHGFFTSEVGATEALIYDPVPGPYKGCVPYEDIGGQWAL